MDNKELNAVVYVLREYAKKEGLDLNKEALIKLHELLIKDLSIHRKIKDADHENDGVKDEN